jgi:quercetin dioxygenase-like cupin family protein
MRITRAAAAPPYSPPLHDGVAATRLQGMEAGPTERFWVGLSVYAPGGAANTAPAAEETVYVVLDGELELTAGGSTETLLAGDSAHLPKGTVRSVRNASGAPARLLVVIGTPS